MKWRDGFGRAGFEWQGIRACCRTYPLMMLVILMGLSIIKASLIISYFMHLRYERRSLVLTLMPALVFVICMMCQDQLANSLWKLETGNQPPKDNGSQFPVSSFQFLVSTTAPPWSGAENCPGRRQS
jgi:hypothetical protein